MSKRELRRWQEEAYLAWSEHKCKGIVGAVTGGGKTIFALACIERRKPQTSLIVVPTIALLDQWWEEAASYFGLALDDINIIESRRPIRRGTINVAVLNTASKIDVAKSVPDLMLVIDECHKAASDKFRRILELPSDARLGLSATPDRPYDDGLNEILIPSLGDVLYQYGYKEALADGVIVPFVLRNLVFDLEDDRAKEHEKLTRGIARNITKFGPDSPEAISLYLKRARVVNLSPKRVEITLRLISANRDRKILVFHEDIEACEVINEVANNYGIKSGLYHSKLPVRARARMLSDFREGRVNILITCRALDEGFNVPETDLGIIAASTATRRQRIQRLGRILRPSSGKDAADIYTLVATGAEVERLRAEEDELEDVAQITWSRA